MIDVLENLISTKPYKSLLFIKSSIDKCFLVIIYVLSHLVNRQLLIEYH